MAEDIQDRFEGRNPTGVAATAIVHVLRKLNKDSRERVREVCDMLSCQTRTVLDMVKII